MGTAHKEVAGPSVVESLEILAEIFHPSYSLPAMKVKVGCDMQLSQEKGRSAAQWAGLA